MRISDWSSDVCSSDLREADQTHALIGVEALDRLHQADVAFLDQVAHAQAVALITARYVHHKAQMRKHQLLGRIEVFLIAEASRQRLLLLGGQHRNAVDRANVGTQRAERTRSEEHTSETPVTNA